jgi:hypothetical protein
VFEISTQKTSINGWKKGTHCAHVNENYTTKKFEFDGEKSTLKIEYFEISIICSLYDFTSSASFMNCCSC